MEAVANLMSQWATARADLAALERADHPDLIDHHGRVWTWKGRGDLYSHDDTLCWPAHWVTDGTAVLPDKKLMDNPNYAKLCGICRSEW